MAKIAFNFSISLALLSLNVLKDNYLGYYLCRSYLGGTVLYKFNFDKLKNLVITAFGETWTDEMRDSYSKYLAEMIKDQTWEKTLIKLHGLFRSDIEEIDIDKRTGYFRNDYKNKVRNFCYQLFVTENQSDDEKKITKKMQWINEWFVDQDETKEVVSNDQIKKVTEALFERILPDCEFFIYGVYQNRWIIEGVSRKKIYLNAVKYHEEQGFKFDENETAVKQLLYYFNDLDFPEPTENSGLEVENDLNLIVSVLIQHIVNFGGPSDYGYAYNGFRILEEYLIRENVPEYLIKMVLEKFPPNDIANGSFSSQMQKQIYKIISVKFKDRKEQLLFQYTKAPVIMRIVMSKLFYGKNSRINLRDDEMFYESGNLICKINYDEMSLENENLAGCTFYWKTDFHVDNKLSLLQFFKEPAHPILKVESSINNQNESFVIESIGLNKSVKLSNDYLKTDWERSDIVNLFNNTRSYLFSDSNMLKESVSGYKTGNCESGLIINFLYIKNYKCLNDFYIWFTDKEKIFEGSKNEQGVSNRQWYKESIYGEKIESLTCVVGRNGSGKTSLIQFMTQILYPAILNTTNSKNNNTINDMNDFFAILTIRNEQYSIGRISEKVAKLRGIERSKIKRLTRDVIDESVNRWAVYDFSNSLTPFSNGAYKEGKNVKRAKSDGENTVLKNWSEDSLRERSRTLSTINNEKIYDTDDAINAYRVFCQRILQEMFTGLHKKNKLILSDKSTLHYKKRFEKFIGELFNGIKFDYYMKIDKDNDSCQFPEADDLDKGDDSYQYPKANDLDKDDDSYPFPEPDDLEYERLCQQTSSGQFTKLIFFAKIYASICKKKSINELFSIDYEENERSLEIEKKNTEDFGPVMIFIDESEIYQHPEWQRKFMYLLLEMIDFFALETKYQIIISTNSPFFLSDLFDDDIYFMSTKRSVLKEKRTFGQNIHTLLSQEFFMDHTIGETSFQSIDSLFRLFNNFEWRLKIDNEWNQKLYNVGIDELKVKIMELKEYLTTVDIVSDNSEVFKSLFSVIEFFRNSSEKQPNITALENNLENHLEKMYLKNKIKNGNKNRFITNLAKELKQYLDKNSKEIFCFYFSINFPNVELKTDGEMYIFLREVIDTIGEKVYRTTLLNALEQCFKSIEPKKNKKDFLKEQLVAIEKELKLLEGEQNDWIT